MSSKAHASHSPTARETAPHAAFKGLLIANNSIPLRMCSHEKCQCCLAKFPSLGCGIMQACSTNCPLDVFPQPSPTSHHPTPPHTIMINPPPPTPTSPTPQAENAALQLKLLEPGLSTYNLWCPQVMRPPHLPTPHHMLSASPCLTSSLLLSPPPRHPP
jgi:hypothetical protein